MRSDDGHAAADQVRLDLGDAAVLGVAEAADQGDDVEAELVLRQGEPALGFGPVGPQVGGAAGRCGSGGWCRFRRVHAGERGEGAAVGVVGPHRPAAVRAIVSQGDQVLISLGSPRRAVLAMTSPPWDGAKSIQDWPSMTSRFADELFERDVIFHEFGDDAVLASQLGLRARLFFFRCASSARLSRRPFLPNARWAFSNSSFSPQVEGADADFQLVADL